MAIKLSDLYDLSFQDFELGPASQITKEGFYKLLNDGNTKRICFASTHANALRPWDDGQKYPYKFVLPFQKSVGPIFTKDTGIKLFDSNFGGAWLGLDEDGYALVGEWTKKQQERVFLRDLLDISIALGPSLESQTELSEIGKLERAAKYDQNEEAIGVLVERMRRAVKRLPFYSTADAVTCVPPREGKEFDLPTVVASRVAKVLGKPFVKAGEWKGSKGQLKEAPVEEKWERLDAAHFEANAGMKGKSVILMDDLYQSGCTLHFTGAKLRASGAKRVFGLSIVKSGRNSDNQ